VVEDDDDVRDSIVEALVGEGYDVLAARNGQEALDLLRTAEPLPGLVLLDLMMPVMDGTDFRAQQLREPRLNAIPVVILSASTQLSSIASQLAADGVLAKPMSLAALLAVAQQYCGPTT
jgi:CheY-like chemotaxis protein